MKILHIIETLGRGGAEHALLNLLPLAQANGVESIVCVLSKPYDLQSELELKGIKVIGLDGLSFMQKRKKLNIYCVEQGIDIIHSHLTRSLILSGFLLGSFKRVNSLHNLGYLAQPARSFKARVKKRVASFVANHRINCHIAVSKAVKEHYKYHYHLKDVSVISNPINVPALKIGNNDSIVVPGRLVAEKGHMGLLDVIKKLEVSGFGFPWVFAGGGVLESKISDKIKQLNLDKTVTITGVLPQSQFFSVMAQSQLIVLPSLSEGFGMAAAEAMTLGKAVVVSDAGGLTELVVDNETGLMFAKGDNVQMYEKLQLILKDEKMKTKLARSGQKYAKDNFSASAIAKSWSALYQGLLS
jgi:GalNAc-alpha-(1->4)-GalNAc-alpha-(1->3)-diNAcBac-PP-undecaprenol alpha-1,4-N-acetyl-D-galactosaminyltransferase